MLEKACSYVPTGNLPPNEKHGFEMAVSNRIAKNFVTEI